MVEVEFVAGGSTTLFGDPFENPFGDLFGDKALVRAGGIYSPPERGHLSALICGGNLPEHSG